MSKQGRGPKLKKYICTQEIFALAAPPRYESFFLLPRPGSACVEERTSLSRMLFTLKLYSLSLSTYLAYAFSFLSFLASRFSFLSFPSLFRRIYIFLSRSHCLSRHLTTSSNLWCHRRNRERLEIVYAERWLDIKRRRRLFA